MASARKLSVAASSAAMANESWRQWRKCIISGEMWRSKNEKRTRNLKAAKSENSENHQHGKISAWWHQHRQWQLAK
jgi:hypothetical protein